MHGVWIDWRCNTFQDAENPSVAMFFSNGRKAPSKLGDAHGDSIFTLVDFPSGEKARDELPSKWSSISNPILPLASSRLTFELIPEFNTSWVGRPGC